MRIVLLAIALLIATVLVWTAAYADTCRLSQSTITLRSTDDPRGVAEIFFDNSSTDGRMQENCPVAWEGITCDVEMIVGGGEPDTIAPECPGYVPFPRELTIVDGTQGVVLLIPAGVGM